MSVIFQSFQTKPNNKLNMAPVNVKQQKKCEAEKLSKHCFTLDEKIKTLDANEKRK